MLTETLLLGSEIRSLDRMETALENSQREIYLMRLSLVVIQKRIGNGSKSENADFQFCIVDLDKSPYYPENFLCVLPKQLKYSEVKDNVIFRIFGENCLKLSKKLLTDALNKQTDPEVRRNILKRLEVTD